MEKDRFSFLSYVSVDIMWEVVIPKQHRETDPPCKCTGIRRPHGNGQPAPLRLIQAALQMSTLELCFTLTEEIAEVDQDQSRDSSPGQRSDMQLMEYGNIKYRTTFMVSNCSIKDTNIPVLFSSADLPKLQEAPEEKEMTAIYQMEAGAGCRAQSGDTRWLTQLAHIATGPQSPLLQESPRSRYNRTTRYRFIVKKQDN